MSVNTDNRVNFNFSVQESHKCGPNSLKAGRNELYFQNAMLHTAQSDLELFMSVIGVQLKSSNPETKRHITEIIEKLAKKPLLSCFSKAQRVFQEILAHTENLEKSWFEKEKRDKIENIALSVYAVLLTRVQTSTQFLPQEFTGLTRDLFYDNEAKKLAVIALPEKAYTKGEGSKKIVRSCALLSLENPLQCHKFSIYSVSLPDIDEDVFQNLIKEIELFCLVPKNARGIVQLESYKIEEGVIHAIYDGYRGSMLQLGLKVNVLQRLLIGLDLLLGLQTLHKTGIVHADMSPKNLVYRTFVNGNAHGALIDLDQSFRVDCEPHNIAFERGYYSALLNTAPELFGVEKARHFTAQDYFRMDIFALGIELKQLLFAEEQLLPWQELIYASYRENFDEENEQHKDYELLHKRQKEMRTHIIEYVEKPLLAFYYQKEEEWDLITRLRVTILRMMRLDPNKRISLDTAIREFKQAIHFETDGPGVAAIGKGIAHLTVFSR
ncbi:MAG TPA: hypothetical protein VN457_00625 [Chlamydiales bacterium]|nr:hypothetical protein [Chlamydiales bacterium]